MAFVLGATSLLGIFGQKKRSLKMLVAHTVLVGGSSVILFLGALACFAFSSSAADYVNEHWDTISPQLHLITLEEAERMARDNMNKLGAACMLFLILLALNTLAGAAACIELSRAKRYGNLNGGDVEMASAYSEEVGMQEVSGCCARGP